MATDTKSPDERAREIDAAIKAADAKRADEAKQKELEGQPLDKLLKGIDSITSSLDKLHRSHADMGRRLDALERKPAPGEPGDGRDLPRDGDDGDDGDDRDVDEKAAGKPRHTVADNQPWMSDDRKREAALLDTQCDYEKVASCWGESTPKYLSGEMPIDYRKRLARRWQRFSADFKDVDLSAISDSAVLAGIEQRIRSDAVAASANPATGLGDVLIPRTRRDETGRLITEFFGQPRSWMQEYAGQRRRVVGIRNTSSH